MTEPRRTFLFGDPISHSLAPLLHNSIYRHHGLPITYTLYESTDTSAFISECIRAPDFAGSAVTMPHKVSIIPHLDALTEDARIIGAVNTIHKEPGRGLLLPDTRLVGSNTDTLGIKAALERALARHPSREAIQASRERSGMVIGGGGTTRAAVYALATFFGCRVIYLLNRDVQEVEAVARNFRGMDGYDVRILDPFGEDVPRVQYIVGAIPDFPAVSSAEQAVRRKVVEVLRTPEKGVLLEMCYKPRHTTILQLAEAEGWTTAEGIEAMIHQGIAQVTLWSGIESENVAYPGLLDLIRTADEVSQSGKRIDE